MRCYEVSISRIDKVQVAAARTDGFAVDVFRFDDYVVSSIRTDRYDILASMTCEVVNTYPVGSSIVTNGVPYITSDDKYYVVSDGDISLPGSFVFDNDTVLLFDDDTQVIS